MRFSHVTTALCRTNPIRSDRKAETGNAAEEEEEEEEKEGEKQSKGFGDRRLPSIVDLQKSILPSRARLQLAEVAHDPKE